MNLKMKQFTTKKSQNLDSQNPNSENTQNFYSKMNETIERLNRYITPVGKEEARRIRIRKSNLRFCKSEDGYYYTCTLEDAKKYGYYILGGQ
jgi:hypothetical protein